MRIFITTLALALSTATLARADAGDEHDETDPAPSEEAEHRDDAGEGAEHELMERMQQAHEDHEHGHDFAALEGMSPALMGRVMDAMMDLGIAVPPMDSTRGRELFVEKGCIVCHQVRGVGGEIGPSLDATDMPEPMNAFEFAARMWRGAPAMVEMQESLFGDVIDLTGQELADLVAFVHDEEAQAKLTAQAIPTKYRELIGE